jgi:hypothetical protein
MGWSSVRYWYEDLEPRDLWKLVGGLALVLLLLTPWRTGIVAEATVKPRDGEAYPLVAPGQGYVKEVRAEKDKMLDPGDLVFSYVPPMDPATYPGYNYTATATSFAIPYQEDERKIRERYQRQIKEAYAYIASDQQQLNRAYSEQGFSRKGGPSYDVQLAQNALARAQAEPGELSRKMEQELAAVRQQRDDYNSLRSSQPGPYVRPPGSAEVPVTATERALVLSLPIRPGSQLHEGLECASLLPEGSAMEIQAAIPATVAKDLQIGMPATLEITAWMHDAELVPVRLEKVGNRNLEGSEVAALAVRPAKEVKYVLVTLGPNAPEGRLFPPPRNRKVRLSGALRCLLQRILL